jgi:CDP-diacylglycerol---glycerol-3-phosphate 3-phosphatidyltransferase
MIVFCARVCAQPSVHCVPRRGVEHNQSHLPAGLRNHPSSVNLPNSITLIRIASIPLLMWILSSSRFSSVTGEKELLASAIFIAAAMTDGIDGYLARKRGQVTTMGILLDPLADKLLIAAAFVTLVQLNPSLVPAWIAVVVIGREFLVSGLRSIAASEGFTIEASELGKFKMVVQIVSVVAVILDHRWKVWPVYGHYFFPIHWIASSPSGLWFVFRWRRRSTTLSPSGRRSTSAW